MKKKLYLITEGFPFDENENTFIEPELPFLKDFALTVISPLAVNEECYHNVVQRLGKPFKVISVYQKYGIAKKIFLAIKSLLDCNLWREWGAILRDKKKIFLRLRHALYYYVDAELFWQELRRKIPDMNDAMFYTYWCTPKTLGLLLHKNKSLHVFTRIHGFDLYNERTGIVGRQPFRAFINETIDGIFFVSRQGLDYYHRTFPLEDESKLHFAPLGISDTPLSPENDSRSPFQLVSCSNVIPVKRVELIIKGLSLVNGCRISWHHFGDGTSMPSVKKLAHELLDDKDNIDYELLGKTPNDEIRAYYTRHSLHAFITTSASEGLPVSIQEAMAAGLPIIGTAVGGIPETIDGNGLLMHSDPEPEEVAAAIEKVLGLPLDEYKTWRQRSRTMWEEMFSAATNHRRFVALIKNLTQG